MAIEYGNLKQSKFLSENKVINFKILYIDQPTIILKTCKQCNFFYFVYSLMTGLHFAALKFAGGASFARNGI